MKKAGEFHEGWLEEFLGSCGRTYPVGSVGLAWCKGFGEERTLLYLSAQKTSSSFTTNFYLNLNTKGRKLRLWGSFFSFFQSDLSSVQLCDYEAALLDWTGVHETFSLFAEAGADKFYLY